MKRQTVVGVAGLSLIASCVLFLGMKTAEPKPPRTISASGTATVAADPDSARLFFEVSAEGKTPTEARIENARRVQAVRAAILSLKLPDLKTKTTDVSVSKVYAKRKDADSPRPVIGYEVTHEFTILIKESSVSRLNASAGRVLDTAIENGVDSTRSISFFKQDTAELKRLAMKQAVENAIANAEAYASGAKVKSVRVAGINGGGADAVSSRFQGQQGQQGGWNMTRGLSTSFLAGKAQITCEVRVLCHF